jgi:thiol-disulfide isomerase/thioredoxin
MSRPALHFLLSLAAAGVGGAALESASRAQAQARVPLLNEPSRMPAPAPAWNNTSWLNSDHPLTLSELKGRVVLLNFWVFTCWNCTNTVPSLVDFDKRYRDQGLSVIGVHPEFCPTRGARQGNGAGPPKYGIRWPSAGQ